MVSVTIRGVTVDEGFEVIEADGVRWRIDTTFLLSNWTCIWGRGCHGIGETRAAHLGHGCCSVGAEIDNDDEAKNVSALADTLEPEMFQHHAEARAEGVFSDGSRTNTRVVDGACIFLNRLGFAGGAGCALHLAAHRAGESPIDWKPSVCWQLPIKVDWADDGTGSGNEIATLRAWSRADWGDEGEIMAWCCTEGGDAFVGERPVIDSLSDELQAVIGTPVFVELRRRLQR